MNTTGHMAKHLIRKHPEVSLEDPSTRRAEEMFKMSMVWKFSTAMDRQLREALCIRKAGGLDSQYVMNSCEEYSRCVLTELQTTTEIKHKEREKRKRETESAEVERQNKKKRLGVQEEQGGRH